MPVVTESMICRCTGHSVVVLRPREPLLASEASSTLPTSDLADPEPFCVVAI
jgi:hypothetical protein